MVKTSVIIPVFNGEKTIRLAIDSLFKQTVLQSNLEIIVVNDGSEDKTQNVLNEYSNIKIIKQKNKGAIKAANTGFKKSCGQYLIKLDADDFFCSTIIFEMVRVFEKHRDIDFVYCDYFEKDLNEKTFIVNTENIFNTVSIGIMFRKSRLKSEGYYDEHMKFSEYDLLLKTLNKWKGFHVKKPLFYYNRRNNSLSNDKKWVNDALRQLHYKYPEFDINNVRKY